RRRHGQSRFCLRQLVSGLSRSSAATHRGNERPMMRLFNIAIRNLTRQKRRTALTGLALFVGIFVTVFLTGFFNGMTETLIRLTVESSIGAIQVHKAGHVEADEPIKFDMPEDAAIISKMKAVP